MYSSIKNSRHGKFVHLKFDDEEDYNDVIKMFEDFIEYEQDSIDMKSMERIIYHTERLKRIDEDGNITSAIFDDAFYDLFSVMYDAVLVATTYKETIDKWEELVKRYEEMVDKSIATTNDYEEITTKSIAMIKVLCKEIADIKEAKNNDDDKIEDTDAPEIENKNKN